MKSDRIKFLLCVLFFVVLATITFRCAWGSDRVFASSDLNIGRLAFIKHLLPDSFIGYYRSVELLGISSFGVSLFNVFLSIMPLTLFADAFYGAMLVSGSLALVWFLRMWSRSWPASVFGALISFWVNSIMLAQSGHAYKMEVLVFSVLGLCLIEKAIRAASIRKTAGFSVLAGLSVGIMMIEQQDVALFAGLFVGSYAVFRLIQAHGKAVLRWLAVLAPIGVVAVLLSGGTVMKSYKSNIAGAASVQGGGDEKWNFITQWSAVPKEWPDLIALGWGGWSTGNPKGPYWGKLGRSAEWETTGKGFQNFKLNSSAYFGMIPFLLGAFGFAGALKNRRSEDGGAVLFWCIAGLLGFWLAFGKYSLLYKLFYQLPLISNIRAPIKLLDNFQICLGITAAYGLDCLISTGKGGKLAKTLWIVSAVFAGLMLLAGLKILAFPASRMAEFSKMGFEPYAEIMVRNMSNAWFHSALLTLLCGGFAFVAWKGFKAAKWIPVAFIAAIAADSLVLTSHHFRANEIAVLKKGNGLINYLKANQGDERIYFMDQGGVYNQWLAADGPFHRLNFFNIWQMSRMPGDYKEFLGTVGQNQIRLWELAAIKYVAAPAGVMQQLQQNSELGKRFQPTLNYQVPTAQGMRKDVLLEFKTAIPRFALFHGWQTVPREDQCALLASPSHNPHRSLLLEPGSNLESYSATTEFQPLEVEVTKRKARMVVQSPEAAVVRFSQYYQPGWRVLVDGEPAKLLRVDYICMGVAVPPGEHIVEFRCLNGALKAIFVLGVLVASIIVAVWLLRAGGKAVE